MLAATMLGKAAAPRDRQPAVTPRARSSEGYSGPSGLARSGGVARSAPRTGRSCCRAQCTVVSTPALWATMVTGAPACLDDLVQVGHPTGQVALVAAEGGDDDGVGQLGGEPGLPVVLDVPAEARHDDDGGVFPGASCRVSFRWGVGQAEAAAPTRRMLLG